MGTAKGYMLGTHRLIPPDTLLQRVLPLLARVGVTRLATITGLDRIGIPTVTAVRPMGSTVSVTTGKGLSLDAARASAAMEAVELHAAETSQLRTWRATARELGSEAAGPLECLPVRQHAVLRADDAIEWTWGTDVLDGRRMAVPADLVRMGESPLSYAPFLQTSNGLASGAVFVEALLTAFLEVVERDAVACARAAPTGLQRVRLESLSHWPLARSLVEQLRRARVEPIIYDCTVDTRVPAFMARIVDGLHRHVGIFYGSGAHLDPEIALIRALTEAVQSRAVYISGSRDDLSAREFARLRAHDSPRVAAGLLAQPSTVDLSALRSCAGATFEADVEYILGRLADVGAQQVIAVDLTPDDLRGLVAVVRVVVPGMAGPGAVRRIRAVESAAA